MTRDGGAPPDRLRILATIDQIGIGGGAEQLLATLLPAIKALGHKVAVAPIGDWTPDLGPNLTRAGVGVHYLHADGGRAYTAGVVRLRQLLSSNPVDIVWSHSRAANIVTRLACLGRRNAPVQVATLHSEGYAHVASLPLRTRLTTTVEDRLLHATPKVAVSRAVADNYAAFFGWKDIAVIPNCIDLKVLPPAMSAAETADIRARYGVASSDFLLVVPARYVEKKGHAILLDALARLKQEADFVPHVLCLGVGPLQDDIQRHAAARGLHVDVLVSTPQQELFRLIRAADGVALPSLREPFGIAAVEAMALGTPLIASRVDGLAEILDGHDCALAVPPGDAAALARAIASLRDDPETARARATRAKTVAGAYEPAAAAQRWDDLFSALLAARQAGRLRHA